MLASEETFTGPSGPFKVQLRLIQPEDAGRVKDFLEALTPESVYYRFLTSIFAPDPSMIENFCCIDQDLNVGIVAVIKIDKDDDIEKIIGEARYHVNSTTNEGEFGILVTDGYQRKGIGTYMMKCLINIASENNLSALIACVHRTNLPMVRFLEKTQDIIEKRACFEDDEFIFKIGIS